MSPEIDFQDGGYGGHHGFLIGTNSAISLSVSRKIIKYDYI